MAMNAGIIGILIVQWLTEDRPPEQNETTFVPWRDGMGNKHTLELRRQFLESRERNRAKLQKSQDSRRAFMNALTDENFDEGKTRKLLKEYLDARAGMEKAIGESMISLRTGIRDPKAKDAFNSRIRQRSYQLDDLARRDSLSGDSLTQHRNPIRARILNKLRQRRTNWQNRRDNN